MLCRISLVWLVSIAISSLYPAHAADLDIVGPAGSVKFGTHVVVLPNGNIVVADPSGPVANIGAVYVYSPNGSLISTLTGGSSGDLVGIGGIQVLPNGNFLVNSSRWRNPATAAANAGAVTWVNGTTGLSGVVSESNSLVGTQSLDSIGNRNATVLSNGNYVVRASEWNNGAVSRAGAAIGANGDVGISGPVTTSNALFGTQPSGALGLGGVVPLSNGNYVVSSPAWKNGANSRAGAVTWVDGHTGLVGALSPANSLVGTKTDDGVGDRGIKALSNGNYVVISSYWKNQDAVSVGAATWANGNTGLIGEVSSANSLVGSSANDTVGEEGVVELANGNYVVVSPSWNNGASLKAGAVTWGSGSSGVRGTISAGNSLVGSSAGDEVGSGVVMPLINGNYAVYSPMWKNGASPKAGAATWGSGISGVSGTISASNSLVGASANDGEHDGRIGSLRPLWNGNYVVINPGWDNGAVADVGAVTWANGASGRTGVISAGNSLTGSTAGDAVGSGSFVALTNGNYVVGSSRWRNGTMISAGAATWSDGVSGRVGMVSAANSLVGRSAYDFVGNEIVGLNNGNYVVASSDWDHGAIVDVGAVTRCNGASGRIGVISPANSLMGGNAGDSYGEVMLALANGDYIAGSASWDNGAMADAGAFTHVDGSVGLSAVPSATNSIVGSTTGDFRSAEARTLLGSNHYAVIWEEWDNGGMANAGAVTILHNTARTRGLVSTVNSVLGTAASGGGRLSIIYDPVLDRALVARPDDNIVTVRALSLFADGFE